MLQMSQVLREYAIAMLTAGMSTRAVTRELKVHFSTNVVLGNLAVCSTGLTTADHVYGVVRASGCEADWTYCNCNLNAQKYSDKILRSIVRPFFKEIYN